MKKVSQRCSNDESRFFSNGANSTNFFHSFVRKTNSCQVAAKMPRDLQLDREHKRDESNDDASYMEFGKKRIY